MKTYIYSLTLAIVTGTVILGCGKSPSAETNRIPQGTSTEPSQIEADLMELQAAESTGGKSFQGRIPGMCKDLYRIRINPGPDTGEVHLCRYFTDPCKQNRDSNSACIAVLEEHTAQAHSAVLAKYQLARKLCYQPRLWSQLSNSYAGFEPECEMIASP